MKSAFLSLWLLAFSASSPAAEPPCAMAAQKQAHKLLIWHSDGDDRASVEPSARALAPLANPANKRQSFSVLEVMGYVHKAQYRMRLIYAASAGQGSAC